MSSPLYSVALQSEEDVVVARRKAREISAILGYDLNDQTRIATAVSEVARDAFSIGGDSSAEFTANSQTRWLTIRISSKNRSVQDLGALLSGDSAAAVALLGAQRLMDAFRVEPLAPKGSTV